MIEIGTELDLYSFRQYNHSIAGEKYHSGKALFLGFSKLVIKFRDPNWGKTGRLSEWTKQSAVIKVIKENGDVQLLAVNSLSLGLVGIDPNAVPLAEGSPARATSNPRFDVDFLPTTETIELFFSSINDGNFKEMVYFL